MIFKCSICSMDFEEEDEEQVIYGMAGCSMMCYDCARNYYENQKPIETKPYEFNMIRNAFYDHYNKRYDLDKIK